MKKHKTKDGRVIAINQMDDNHLYNTIKYFIRRLSIAKDIINEEKKGNKFFNKINGVEFDIDAAEDYVESFNDMIGNYIYEALIRNIDIKSLISEIQELIERKGAITVEQSGFEQNVIEQDYYLDD
jgi:predicted transcriptional regulator